MQPCPGRQRTRVTRCRRRADRGALPSTQPGTFFGRWTACDVGYRRARKARIGRREDAAFARNGECSGIAYASLGSIFGALALLGPMVLVNPGLESVAWSPMSMAAAGTAERGLQRGRARAPGGVLKIPAACTSASIILSKLTNYR